MKKTSFEDNQEKMLRVRGARENNLKDLSVDIPHGKLSVLTGVSGSGKSSLAYNVIYRESQRRFMESFSSFSRQYLGKMEKPDVDAIHGLQAALAINQKSVIANPRSTVGTMSGIYDHLRLLFARTGKQDHNQDGNGQAMIRAKLFSFNSPAGACPTCKGLGITESIDKQKLISDPGLSLRQGALVPTTPNGYIVYSQVRVDELDKVCRAHGFSVDVPWKDLSPAQQDVIWYGSDRVKILFGKHSLESRLKWKGITARPREEAYFKGMIPVMEDILHRDRNDNILRFTSSGTCTDCGGSRLNDEALSVKIDGKTIAEFSEYSLEKLQASLSRLQQKMAGNLSAVHILDHILHRLEYLHLLGLSYLTLSRPSTSLSGGEAQRIRLAAQVGSGLQGILYILDEPSIGLHSRDNQKLLKVLRSLRDNGNTLLVVEHDEETIRKADHLIDIGPGPGEIGGKVVYAGKTDRLLENPDAFPESITAACLAKLDNIRHTPPRKAQGTIRIKGASAFNLKNIDVRFKLGTFNAVTGVSGAGKSSLVNTVLAPFLMTGKNNGTFATIECSTMPERVISIDQSPIGRTPRSNPATYTGLFDHIRALFARQPVSRERKYTKGRFSFNNAGGRCENCQGAGYIQLGMHFLGDVEVLCEKCRGRRFNNETLEISWNGKNIADVLEMTASQARKFFEGEEKIIRILDQMIELGIGYLRLGQASTTLSGGEAQRIKLASELYKNSKGHGVYILDEPSTGLHAADIQHLLLALNRIVDKGHTVILIEHETTMIRQADHIIDLGPEGGDGGGWLVASGSPEEVMLSDASYTGQALRNSAVIKKDAEAQKQQGRERKSIRFRGIGTNNLKNIDVTIPLGKTTVITGISGSGKSSLAFDTLYAESRNRFTESFSTYARRMMSKVKRAELEDSSGLTPAIAVGQNRHNRNPRSTLGTATEIYDLLRLLFSRAGTHPDGSQARLPASMFSFNKAEAACPECKGLGMITRADPEKFISHPGLSFPDGAMSGSSAGRFFGDPYGRYVNTLLKVGESMDLDFSLPVEKLTPIALSTALYGSGEKEYEVEWHFRRGKRTGTHHLKTEWKGFVHYFTEDYEIKRHGERGKAYLPLISEYRCPVCKGDRLKPEALEIQFDGMNISTFTGMQISKARSYFEDLMHRKEKNFHAAAAKIAPLLIEKLRLLEELGLGYLSIDRQTSSLSGGEARRLSIAGQVVSELCGLTYIMDEPTAGLHPRDTMKLMGVLNNLKSKGNTIVMVEHDPEVIRQADNIIDMGPGAGDHGGRIIAEGSPEQIMEHKASVTGPYLKSIQKTIPVQKRKAEKGIMINSAQAHNLKNIDLQIPVGRLVVLTGVSGSGKSSLAFDVIAASFRAGKAVNCKAIDLKAVDSLLVTDQERIGTSPLSTPATYTGLFDHIRDIFAREKSAKNAGLKKSHFSFNSKEGQCPFCKGMGSVKSNLDFLADIWVPCEVCHGKRYKEAVLEVQFGGLTIHEVLELEVDEALRVFGEHEKCRRILNILQESGLGYLKLGQACNTLSGGETQRLKLAAGLLGEAGENTFYIFDEPSSGLHMKDIEQVLKLFHRLTNEGHTVLAIEHNTAIIRAADEIIDLGPEGGDEGGYILFQGSPEEIMNCPGSYTGQELLRERNHSGPFTAGRSGKVKTRN